MAESFSFGFGGDDIEQDFNGEEFATENARFVEHHDPISEPQLHAVKDLVRYLLRFLLSRLRFRLFASRCNFPFLNCATWPVIGIVIPAPTYLDAHI